MPSADSTPPTELPANQTTLAPTQTPDPITPSPSPLPTSSPTISIEDLSGQFLLIQTAFDQFQYLNPSTLTTHPVDLPIVDPQFRLSQHLSPSGTRFFIPQPDGTALIFDLNDNAIESTFNTIGQTIFSIDAAISQAREYFAEDDFTDAFLTDLIYQAHMQSIQNMGWYLEDRYLFLVQDIKPTSTALHLYDLQTGNLVQLEDEPGLVKNFWVGPNRDQILLEKAFVFQPGIWQDNHYYLVNVSDQTVQEIPLPEFSENPAVSWFSEDYFGIVHRVLIRGGTDFSILNTSTVESIQIIRGDFSHFHRFDDRLFLIWLEPDLPITHLEILSLDGHLLSTKTIDSICHFQSRVFGRIFLNCENESLIVDYDLRSATFADPIQILSPAPDGSVLIVITRTQATLLLDSNLNLIHSLSFEDTPMEIRWLPGSSGVLYRTRGSLFHHDLTTNTSTLVLQSDLFSDYVNLNAVWVNLD